MRSICFVSAGRSDWTALRAILNAACREPSLAPWLVVTGAHLVPHQGHTVDAILADGYEVDARIDMLMASDTPSGVGRSMGLGVAGFADLFARRRPDLLLVLGDRFEAFSAALASVPFNIPIAHVHGGELTYGAFDDALRHALTKLSHLHFAATEAYARRIVQMGEEAWRVHVSGSPSLDVLDDLPRRSVEELEARLGLALSPSPVLVTFHPVTRDFTNTDHHLASLLGALRSIDRPVVLTLPNADTRSSRVREALLAYAAERSDVVALHNLGTVDYFNLLAHAAVMVGNSSSGIIEAPSFGLPVVNIGTRQAGRLRARNVIDVGYDAEEIRGAIAKALSPGFRAELVDCENPYRAGGPAGPQIARVLSEVELDPRLTAKEFVDA